MPNKRDDTLGQIAALGGTFLMIAAQDSSEFESWIMPAGVNFIFVVDPIVITELEELDIDGVVHSVIADGTAGTPGQKIEGVELPAGTFLKPRTPGGFVKIVTGASPETGKIICCPNFPK